MTIMAARLGNAHVPHRLIRMEGFNHAFDVFPTYPPQGPPVGLRQGKVAEAFDEVVKFLETQLKRSSVASATGSSPR